MSLKVLCRIAAQPASSLCVFTAAVPDSTHVVATATPVPSETLQSSAADPKQLNSLRSKLLDGAFIFQFDSVFDSTQAFSQPALVCDLVTGRDAAVLVFGTSRSGKDDCHKEAVFTLVAELLKVLTAQRSQHSLGCRVISVGPDGVLDRKCYSQITKPGQVAPLIAPEDPRTATVLRLQVLRGQTPLSTLDIVNLPYAELAKHKTVARIFNSISASLARTGGKSTALSELLMATLDIYHPMNPSQVVVVCCVSPEPEEFSHSLAALKFTSRLRDCVKLKRIVNRGKEEEDASPRYSPHIPSSEPSPIPAPRLTTARRDLLSINTDLDPLQKDRLPTTKAIPVPKATTSPLTFSKGMQAAPLHIKPLDLRHLLYRDTPSRDSKVWATEREGLRGSELQSDRSSGELDGHSSARERATRSIQTSRLFSPLEGDSEIVQTSIFETKEEWTQLRPSLHVFPASEISIKGRNPQLQTQEIQTLPSQTTDFACQMVMHTADTASQMAVPAMEDTASQNVVQTVTRGENTSHKSHKSASQQMSVSFEPVPDLQEVKALEEQLQHYHRSAEDLRIALDQQREESEELIDSLRTQLLAVQGDGKRIQTSSSVQTDAKGPLEKVKRGLCDVMNALASLNPSNASGDSKAGQAAGRLAVALRTAESWEGLGEVLNLHLDALSGACLDSLRSAFDEIAKGKAELESTRKRMFDISNLCATLEAEIGSLQHRLSASSQDLNSAKEELRQAEERAREWQLVATQQGNRITQQDTLQGKVHSLETELAALAQENAQMVKKMRSTIQTLDTTKGENTSLVLKYKLLESIRAQEQEESATQFTKLASEAKQSSEMAQELLTSSKQKDEIIASLKTQLQGLTGAEGRVQDVEVENAQLHSALNVAIGEKEAAAKEIESVKRQLELAYIETERCKSMQSHLEAMQEDMAKERRKGKELAVEIDLQTQAFAHLEQEKTRLEERFASILQAKEGQLSTLTADLANIRSALKEKTIAVQETESKAFAGQREVEKLRSDYDSQGKQLTEALVRCQKLESQLGKLRAELVHTSSALEARQDQVESLSLQASALTDALRENELDAAKDRFSKSKTFTESDLGQSRKGTDGRDMELAALRKARDRLELDNKRLNETLQRLNITLQDVQSSKKLTLESVLGQTLQQMKQKTEPILEIRELLRDITSRFAGSRDEDCKRRAPEVQTTLGKLQGYLAAEEQWQRSVGERLESLKASAAPGISSDLFGFLQQSLAPPPAFAEFSSRSSAPVRSADHQLCELQSAELKATLAELRTERDELQAQIASLRSTSTQKQADFDKIARSNTQKDLELHKLRQGLRAYEEIIAELRASLQRSAAETQTALEEKLQALAEVKGLQQRIETMDEGSSPKGRPGSLTEYLRQKDESEVPSRPPEGDLRHFQRFKALWQASPFNTQSS